MNDYLNLFAGVLCAAAGGELFVRGAVGLAYWARISPGIIGTTVVAFATSSPEIAVSVSAAASGAPQLSLGDALGSNIVNVALILGIALCIAAIQSPRDTVKRDFPVALLVPVITGVLFLDGVLSRTDGVIMLTVFLAWIVAVILEVRRQRSAAAAVLGEHKGWLALVLSCAGLVLLLLAGRLIVAGAKGIAVSFGIDEFIVGATIVSIGTSVPELATTVIARIRGHEEIALGTILGSNILNGLFVVSVAALIAPITIALSELAVVLVLGVSAVALTFPSRTGLIGRRRGAALLALYLVYIAAFLQGGK